MDRQTDHWEENASPASPGRLRAGHVHRPPLVPPHAAGCDLPHSGSRPPQSKAAAGRAGTNASVSGLALPAFFTYKTSIMRHTLLLPLVIALAGTASLAAADPGFTTETRQITFGPKQHFFGYIGHVGNVPWNAGDRYILALRTDFQDRMPTAQDAAEIVLIDTQEEYRERVVDRTRAWNPQQGTMLYWNPEAPETQFFFNDRDPATNRIFCVLFDISKGERIAEFRYDDVSFGNSGVARKGGSFLGINYGRLARLRPVTGYPGAADWHGEEDKHPADDGIFKVNVKTKQKQLLVSYAQLADAVRADRPDVDEKELFINHTLWNPDDSRIYFFVRGTFGDAAKRLDIPFTMKADGSDLRPLAMHIGGHPEWLSPTVLIGSHEGAQILFDIDQQKITGALGTKEIFPNPGGDVAMSPDGKWFVNGHGKGGKNYYTFLRLADGAWVRTGPFDQGGYIDDVRVDPGPCWNRASDRIVIAAQDEAKTRQMFVIELKRAETSEATK